MAEPAGPFHVLRAGQGRFLCYCRPGGAVCVTDAMEVWAGDLGDCPALDCRCPPEEHGAMLRAALGRGAAELSLGPGSATLRLPEEPRCPALALALAQLPAAEARSQLQALVFGMAGCIESLERRLEAVETLASSCSLQNNTARSQQLFLPAAGPARLGCWKLALALEGLAGLPEHLADLQSTSCLPLTEADPSPRKNKAAGSALPAKRRVPGESLINPGFKSKKAPSGVNFEDS